MSHYYSREPSSAYRMQLITHVVAGRSFQFYTADGVFSKRRIDYGSHLLIDVVQQSAPLSGHLLDIGCGYGPIATSLAVLNPALTITMVDVNPRALELAEKNAAHHNLVGRYTVLDADDSNLQCDQFNIVVLNPPIRAGKAVIQQLYQLAYRACLVGGSVFVVIQKKQGMASSKTYLTERFGHCQIIAKDKGYYVLRSDRTI